MRTILAHAALAAALVLTLSLTLRADEVTKWNGIALDAIRLDRTPPPKASRARDGPRRRVRRGQRDPAGREALPVPRLRFRRGRVPARGRGLRRARRARPALSRAA